MTTRVLDGRLGRSVTIDLCLPCQAFWFDGHESLQLAPGATLALFELIGEQAGSPRSPARDAIACPRCQTMLRKVSDLQRRTRFFYRSCPRGHGRFITFFDFLREKNFVRPLTPQRIDELRANVRTVTCSACGAGVDLVSSAVCAHCGSPLSMLDMSQAAALVAELREAEHKRATVDPALPLRRAEARLDVERSFAALDRGPRWFEDVSAVGIVEAGLGAVSRWLKGR